MAEPAGETAAPFSFEEWCEAQELSEVDTLLRRLDVAGQTPQDFVAAYRRRRPGAPVAEVAALLAGQVKAMAKADQEADPPAEKPPQLPGHSPPGHSPPGTPPASSRAGTGEQGGKEEEEEEEEDGDPALVAAYEREPNEVCVAVVRARGLEAGGGIPKVKLEMVEGGLGSGRAATDFVTKSEPASPGGGGGGGGGGGAALAAESRSNPVYREVFRLPFRAQARDDAVSLRAVALGAKGKVLGATRPVDCKALGRYWSDPAW